MTEDESSRRLYSVSAALPDCSGRRDEPLLVVPFHGADFSASARRTVLCS